MHPNSIKLQQNWAMCGWVIDDLTDFPSPFCIGNFRDVPKDVNSQDRDETETFHFPKLSRPRRDETFNLQDQDETETFQKTYRDRSVAV